MTNRRRKISSNAIKPVDPSTLSDFTKMLNMVNNTMLTRGDLAGGRYGMQFGGERDLYGTFGYKQVLSYTDYRMMYDRMGLATRLVEKFSNDTWNSPPVLIDGDARSDNIGDKTTPFLTEWTALAKRLKVWQIMREADIMCGIGKYSVILMGFPGTFDSKVTSGNSLFYVSAYDESQAPILSFVSDTKSDSYGLPEYYNIVMQSFTGGANSTETQKTHYSRCIHISENRLGSRVFGRPRMQEVYNRLMDLEKVTGGGAEAAWLAVYMGFLILTREGIEMPSTDSEEWRQTNEAIQAFAHRIQRFATLKGVEEVVNLGVHEVRIKDIYGVLATDLAGSKGVPQRILFGSERGELASSQDMQEWNGVIKSRRTNFAEPEILDPFIKRCVDTGVIPAPKSGKYTVEWVPVYSLSQMEEADYAFKIAQAANMLTAASGTTAVEINEFRGMIHLPPQSEADILANQPDNPPTTTPVANPQGVSDSNPTNGGQGNLPGSNPTVQPVKEKVNGK